MDANDIERIKTAADFIKFECRVVYDADGARLIGMANIRGVEQHTTATFTYAQLIENPELVNNTVKNFVEHFSDVYAGRKSLLLVK